MRILGREIGTHSPPLIVVEIGINHGGDLDVAKEMVTLAYKAGAECVKHQTHCPEDEMTQEAKQIYPPNSSDSIWDIISKCTLSFKDERALKEHSESLGLIYLSTPFSRKATDLLAEIGVPAFKIGSGEADNIPLIRHIATYGKPVILSTGMQSIRALKKSVEILRNAHVEFALLECTNLYPSPPECVSLRGLSELREAFPDAIIGFSDHSIGPEMALASIALGASIVERHFTDNRYRHGPDISCSMDPAELSYLIHRAKELHSSITNTKSRSKAEESVYRFARASIVADRDLPANHLISATDIWARRPGNGEIPASDFDQVVGRRLVHPVERNQQLQWSDFSCLEDQ